MFAACLHGVFNRRLKVLVERLQHLVPVHLAVGYGVKLLLHVSCEVIVHDSREILHEEIVNHHTDVGRHQLTLLIASYFLLIL